MGALVNLKNTCDDFSVEFEVLAPVDFTKEMDERPHLYLLHIG